MTVGTISFTGVVVAYNEAALLPRCLESIAFCAELIVVDLGSTDGSVDVARRFGARVLAHERVDFPNVARQFGISQARNEWVITTDPDEVFPKDEIHKVESIIAARPDLAAIRVPCLFYFRGKPLRCTVWGRPGLSKWAVLHRDRARGTPYVHEEFERGADVYAFPSEAMRPVEHYWVQSYRELFEKHARYVKHEGEKMHDDGQRFSWSRAFIAAMRALKGNLIDYRGIKGGASGLFLSLFHAGYVFASWCSLRTYERQLAAASATTHARQHGDS